MIKHCFCHTFYSFCLPFAFGIGVSLAHADVSDVPTVPQTQDSLLTLEFQDMPIKAILDVLAQMGQVNIVATDIANTNMTLRLNRVSWQQALDIVVNSNDLTQHHQGNIIYISSHAKLLEAQNKQNQARLHAESLLPLQTKYIALHYADAEQVMALILGVSAGTTNNTNAHKGLLSARGVVSVDKRTNMLIVKDIDQNIASIQELISRIDVPVRQVMIEARIVSANDGFSRQLGVNFGLFADNGQLQIAGSQSGLWDLRRGDLTARAGREDNLAVNLGVGNPAGRIAFGILNIPDVLLDLELSAMQADRKGEVISTPKVLTTDKQTAKISSGTQIAYQESTSSGATSTSFKEAALLLEATPSITPEGKIALKLNIRNGSPVQNLGAIAIQEDAIETQVVVENGQTVVLGGIYRHTTGNSVEKVPLLGDIPYVGKLFRREHKTNSKDELLIFVTPKLVP